MQDAVLLRNLLREKSSEEIVAAIESLSDEEVLALQYDWRGIWAREKQILPDGDWDTWLNLAGRGGGKTRTGSETVREWKNDYPRIHLVGPTAGDVRDVMVEGESGILTISPPWDKPDYEPSKRKLTWKNGAVALLFSAEEPDRLRGPQCYKAWADEVAAWKYEEETWDQLQFGLRLGDNPQVVATSTPRPTKTIKELVKDPSTHLTKYSTYDNKANLSPKFFDRILAKYEGTRLGRQEIHAEILEDVEGALWNMELIEANRRKEAPELTRIVVAIDPAVTNNPDSDETGIVAVGKSAAGIAYVLEDDSGNYSPKGWAMKAIKLLDKHQGNIIVAEVNNGGDLVEANIKSLDPSTPYKAVRASRGKVTRAEPVVSLYEQGKVKHVGSHPELEKQMTTWDAQSGEKSPDRVDALVWAVTELLLNENKNYNWST